MKGTIETNDTREQEAEQPVRRGLFRRSKRSTATSTDTPTDTAAELAEAVSTVDELARRIDLLANGGTPAEIVDASLAVTTQPSADEHAASLRAALDAQRAVIARANEASSDSSTTPEAPVSDLAATTTTDDDIEARLNAALTAAPVPPVSDDVDGPTQDAVLQPTTPSPTPTPAPTPTPTPFTTSLAAPTAASLLGIDVERMARLLEEEALSAQNRIELEVRNAHTQSAEILDRAEREADRIREHGQAQARVLLGEVEEIISEAQQTGEQILERANAEASELRGDATAVLQQAQAEARAIVDTARREGEQVLAEQRRLATVRAQEAMREQDRLKDQIRRLEERRRQVLESLEPLISQLTQMMPVNVDANVVPLDRTRGTHS